MRKMTASPALCPAKTCPKCNTEKPLTDFHKDPTHKDGHRSICGKCATAYVCARKPKNPYKRPEIGKTYGGVIVLRHTDDVIRKNGSGTRRSSASIVFCSRCGQEGVLPDYYLTSGKNVSCGCKIRLLGTEAAFRRLFKQYQGNAKQRNHEFSLTEDQFRTLISSDCYYCGNPPSQVHDVSRSYTKHKPEPLVYNGVDRKENTVGYQNDNCVSCCKTCNYLKREMSVSEFMAHLKRVISHMAEKEARHF
jgi:hypothetical protein